MSDLKSRFQETVAFVQNSEGDFKPSNDLKLKMYALYKQASQGDVTGKKPGMLDVVGGAKYKAWQKLKGTSQDSAMQSYIDAAEEFR